MLGLFGRSVGLLERKLILSDVSALFHTVLFAYQKALRDAIGENATAVITWRTIPIIDGILGNASPELAGADDTDEALQRYADLLMASELVRKVSVERDGDRYLLDIDGCAFAEEVHPMLSPRDVTCPWAIVAMAIAQKTGKRSVRMNLSDFGPTGAKTTIEFLQ